MKAVWLTQARDPDAEPQQEGLPHQLGAAQVTLRRDLPHPEPGPGQALVRVRLAGVCSTDLALIDGYYPFNGVLGHEFVGEIRAAPSAPERVGERVVGSINLSCGHCPECLACRPSHCRERRVLGIKDYQGAFAEYLTLPLENLFQVPDGVSDSQAVFAEPLAAALQIPELVQIRPSDRVLVVGAGRLGQLIARVIALSGADLRVVARHDHQHRRLSMAGIQAIEEEAVSQADCDLVVEASGAPSGFALARRAVRPRGTLCIKSTYRGEVPISLSSLVVDEIRLVGSRCGPFPPALRLLAEQRIDLAPLIDVHETLTEGPRAIQRAADSDVLKAVIQCC